MQVSDYDRMQLKEHIYHRPDTYVGSDSRLSREEYMMNPSTGKIVVYQTTMPVAMKSLFKEIISNAADNVPRSMKFGIDPGVIAVNINQLWVECYNEGVPPPAEYKTFRDGSTLFLPQAIFGELLAGSNLNDNVVLEGAGRNGFGAKLTNIYSTIFQLTAFDHTRRLWYRIEWRNNMNDIVTFDLRHYYPEHMSSNPIYQTGWAGFSNGAWVSSTPPSEEGMWGPTNVPERGIPNVSRSFVYIRYHLDYRRFGYVDASGNITGNTADVIAVYEAVLNEYAYTTKVPFFYNGKQLDCDTPHKFFEKIYHPVPIADPLTKTYIPGPSTLKQLDYILHYEWREGVELVEGKNGHKVPVDPRVRPVVEMLAVCTPDNGSVYSYVNCQRSPLGGVHVEAAYSAVSSALQEHLKAILAKRRGGKNKDEKFQGRSGVTVDDIKRHITLIINCYLPNAKYQNQTKDYVTEPKVGITLTEKEKESMKGWDIIGKLIRYIDMKNDADFASKGQRRGYRKCKKAEEANMIDKVHPSQLTVHSLEGDSAMGYAVTAMKFMGRDYNTLFPWRGKILNVAKCNETEIQGNKEVQEFIELMGFKPNVDYRTPEGFATLRHGNMTWMNDADPDGDHIRGLGINMIAKLFPTYFMSPYANIFFYVTPLVRIGEYSFYSEADAQQFINENPNLIKGKEVRYMKGLGSSNKEDVARDFRQPLFARVVYDESAPEYLRLSFGKMSPDVLKELSEMNGGRYIPTRKDWLLSQTPSPIPPTTQVLNTSTWINYAIRSYFVYTYRRAIPDARDGLKESQRKILYTLLKKNLGRIKVNHLGSTVSKFTDYHHGEKSLEDAIKGLAMDFPGSNNVNYLVPDGQFGTINKMGKDAADGRYSYTYLTEIVKYLVDIEFLPHVERIKHGEYICEPHYIPMNIAPFFNGFNGIAGGWSTYCPNYHPLDMAYLTKYFICKKIGVPFEYKDVTPYYRGFLGKIDVGNTTPEDMGIVYYDEYGMIDHNAAKAIKEYLIAKGGKSMRTYGVFQVLGSDRNGANIRVTCLPVGMATATFKEWLDEMINISGSRDQEDVAKRIENGITIKHYDNYSDDNSVNFVLYGVNFVKGEMQEGKVKVKTLKGTDIKTTSGETKVVLKEVLEPAVNITHKHLRLVNSYGLTNMHLLCETGIPKHFNSIADMVENFVNQRYPDYEKLVKIRQDEKKEELDKISLKARYVGACVSKTIVLEGMKKSQAAEYIATFGFPEEMLKTTQLECTIDVYQELMNKVQKLTEEYNHLLTLHPAHVWVEKIDRFVEYYIKHNK